MAQRLTASAQWRLEQQAASEEPQRRTCVGGRVPQTMHLGVAGGSDGDGGGSLEVRLPIHGVGRNFGATWGRKGFGPVLLQIFFLCFEIR